MTASIKVDSQQQQSRTSILLEAAASENKKYSTMADCLDADDPVAALVELSALSKQRSIVKSAQLADAIQMHMNMETDTPTESSLTALTLFQHDLPVILEQPQNTLNAVQACADSIQHSLTKIASGGSAASQEIRALERKKSLLVQDSAAVEMALQLRRDSVTAAQSLSAQAHAVAAEHVRPWLLWSTSASSTRTSSSTQTSSTSRHDLDLKIRQYVGDYCLQQLQTTHAALQETVLRQYQAAVEAGDLQQLGQLTPVLSQIQLSQQAVTMYLKYLKLSVLAPAMEQAVPNSGGNKEPPFVPMARVYNAAVQTLRHHLPMVSHCLHEAAGDVAVVQLVHLQVQQTAVALLEQFQRAQKLAGTSRQATRIYAALEERYAGTSHRLTDDDDCSDDDDDDDMGGGHNNNNGRNDNSHMNQDDCGFSTQVGTLSDVDASLEEAALCIQHAESYTRFMQHCCQQVQQARYYRFQQEQELKRREREREEWNHPDQKQGNKNKNKSNNNSKTDDDDDDDDDDQVKEYSPIEILPICSSLDQAVAELGGQYASIERCLLLASMQRAFVTAAHNDGNQDDQQQQQQQQQKKQQFHDPRYYRPLSLGGNKNDKNSSSQALQTAFVETCLYAARRGTQRAFATGHTGTASAMTNFCVDCLQNVLLEVLSHRAEESGVAMLKPGDGLLVGSAGLFNATSNLIRQGTHNVSNAVIRSHTDELARKHKTQQGIARACATLNDLEVAVYHTEQLESVLADATAKGFPPEEHTTEQLQMCVKSLSTVTDSFKIASDATVESVVSVLRPRIRSIVGEAIGGEGGASAASAFMGSSSEKVAVRMNYNLDEAAYNLQQLSEGFVARLCSLLDELVEPVRLYLAPRLWDALLVGVIGTVCKRLETSLRNKCEYTALGALALDSDVRDLLHYTKDRLYGDEYQSNAAVAKACPPLNRLLQIAKLLNVDDLEDVVDLIASSKRKGNWDLKLDDAKAYLSLRVEFESDNVSELLRLPDDN
jgi:hypothetical protein